MSYLENLDQRPLQVMLDEQQVPDLWLTIISKMNPGEHSRTECNFSSPDLPLLNNSPDELLNLKTFCPKGCTCGYLYIKLESLDSGLCTDSLEIPERNTLGLKLKDEANTLFKSCEFEKAIKLYKSSLATLEPQADDPSILKPSCALVLGNISLCYLRINDFANAEKFASQALDLLPNEAKYLLRRAQAKIGNSRLDSALEDLRTASSLAGEGDLQNSIKKEIQFIKQEFARVHEVEKKRYKNLFK
jgi:tetratricopeptide (TPR) repeat protein